MTIRQFAAESKYSVISSSSMSNEFGYSVLTASPETKPKKRVKR